MSTETLPFPSTALSLCSPSARVEDEQPGLGWCSSALTYTLHQLRHQHTQTHSINSGINTHRHTPSTQASTHTDTLHQLRHQHTQTHSINSGINTHRHTPSTQASTHK